MGQFRVVKRCHLCGAVLQSQNKKEKGYIAAGEYLNNKEYDESILYCDSCFAKMKSINKSMLEKDTDDEILEILKDARATDSAIIYVLDAFYFDGHLNPEVVKKIKNLKLSVYVTRFEFVPSRYEEEKLINFVKESFNAVGLNPVNVIIDKKAGELDFEKVLERLNAFRNGHDVYIIGSAASGKSLMITKYLKKYKNTSKRQINQITYENTNVKVLEIPLGKTAFVYELPSFSLVNSCLGRVEKETAKILTVSKAADVRYYRLNQGEAMIIGALAAFAVVKGKETRFRLFASDAVEVTPKVKLNQFESTLNRLVEKRFVRPFSEKYTMFSDFDLLEIDIPADNKYHDIHILGLGWVTFRGKGQTIRVMTPKGVEINETMSKVK